jgi:ketosteroid isomerase-like protein
MHHIARPGLVGVLLISTLFGARPARAQDVWALENAYWQSVQANDLSRYRALFHEHALGWPSSNAEPAHRAQITDWITAHTSKGETLKSYEIEHLAVEVIDNLTTVTDRVRFVWADPNGMAHPGTARVIHTWLRGPDGKSQIISGMSAPTNAEGH